MIAVFAIIIYYVRFLCFSIRDQYALLLAAERHACCTQEINRPSLVASCLGAFCNELFAQCSTSRSYESQCDIGVAFAVPLLFCILFERRAADVDLANSHSDGRRIAFDRLKSC